MKVVLSTALQIIADEVGLGPASRDEIMDLARRVGMENEIVTDPKQVAKEITRYLDDLAENP